MSKRVYLSNATTKFLEEYSLKLIGEVSSEETVDPMLIRAIAEKESALYPFAMRVEPNLLKKRWFRDAMARHDESADDLLSTASYGLLQILYVNVLDNYTDMKPLDLLGNPDMALRCGIKHLKRQIARYDGDMRKAISAYNWGHATWRNYWTYVKPIMDRWKELA